MTSQNRKRALRLGFEGEGAWQSRPAARVLNPAHPFSDPSRITRRPSLPNILLTNSHKPKMNLQLSPDEIRVIGCLIEKSITTPDQYPLSINSLTNACNQKSNRDPVLELSERDVQATVDGLVRKHLVLEKSGFGSRVPKYQHRFCNTGFGSLEFTPTATAVLCELMLRGPQTPGELRARASRMAQVQDVGDIEVVLQALATREDGPFVVRLPREPGRRDSRYAHLFGGPIEISEEEQELPVAASEPRGPSLGERVAQLEHLVAQLRMEVEELKRR